MPPHDRSCTLALIPFLVLFVLACARENPAPDRPALPIVARVGSLHPDGEIGWLRPISAAVAPDGGVAVLDAGVSSVLLFRAGTRDVMRVGHPGRGPGEFASPSEVAFNDAGELGILDLERRLVVFDDAGEHLRSRALEGGTPTALLPTTGGFVVRLARPGVGGSLLYVHIGAEAGGRTDTLVTVRSEAGVAGPTTCQFCPTALSPDGTVILASGDTTYAIRELDRAAGLVRTWARQDVPGIPLSGNERDSALSRWDAAYAALRARGGPSMPLPVIARFKRRILPHGLAFDGRSRLWVQRSVAELEPATFDLFTREGEFLGEVKLDRPGELLALRDSTLVALHTVESGEPEVIIYRIRDPHQ